MRPLEEIATTLSATPEIVAALFASVDESVLRQRPEPREWAPMEVVGHLIACDRPAFEDRIVAILEGASPLAGFDPWEAIDARDFTQGGIDELIDEFRASRVRAADFVRSLDPATLTMTGHFGDGRAFAASDFVHEWPFHDHDHLQRSWPRRNRRTSRRSRPRWRRRSVSPATTRPERPRRSGRSLGSAA